MNELNLQYLGMHLFTTLNALNQLGSIEVGTIILTKSQHFLFF